eukprot:gene10712-11434_t
MDQVVWARFLADDTEQPWRAFDRESAAELESWLAMGMEPPTVPLRLTRELAYGEGAADDPVALDLALSPGTRWGERSAELRHFTAEVLHRAARIGHVARYSIPLASGGAGAAGGAAALGELSSCALWLRGDADVAGAAAALPRRLRIRAALF